MKNWRSFIFYNNKLSNCPLTLVAASHKLYIHVSVRLLTIKISQWARENFVLLLWNANYNWCFTTKNHFVPGVMGKAVELLYTGSVKKVLVRLCSVTLTQDKLATDPKMFVCAFADVIQRAQGLQNGQTWRRCSNHLFVQWPFYLCYFS